MPSRLEPWPACSTAWASSCPDPSPGPPVSWPCSCPEPTPARSTTRVSSCEETPPAPPVAWRPRGQNHRSLVARRGRARAKRRHRSSRGMGALMARTAARSCHNSGDVGRSSKPWIWQTRKHESHKSRDALHWLGHLQHRGGDGDLVFFDWEIGKGICRFGVLRATRGWRWGPNSEGFGLGA